MKVFTGISEEATDTWFAPEIKVPPTKRTPDGMLSEIPAGRFRETEGVQYTEI